MNVQGNIPAKYHEGYGAVPSLGNLATLEKITVKTKHRENRTQDSPNNTDDCLFVAYGNITPGKYLKEFSIEPQIAPVVLSARPGSII